MRDGGRGQAVISRRERVRAATYEFRGQVLACFNAVSVLSVCALDRWVSQVARMHARANTYVLTEICLLFFALLA